MRINSQLTRRKSKRIRRNKKKKKKNRNRKMKSKNIKKKDKRKRRKTRKRDQAKSKRNKFKIKMKNPDSNRSARSSHAKRMMTSKLNQKLSPNHKSRLKLNKIANKEIQWTAKILKPRNNRPLLMIRNSKVLTHLFNRISQHHKKRKLIKINKKILNRANRSVHKNKPNQSNRKKRKNSYKMVKKPNNRINRNKANPIRLSHKMWIKMNKLKLNLRNNRMPMIKRLRTLKRHSNPYKKPNRLRLCNEIDILRFKNSHLWSLQVIFHMKNLLFLLFTMIYLLIINHHLIIFYLINIIWVLIIKFLT